jgi:hypothetical protein
VNSTSMVILRSPRTAPEDRKKIGLVEHSICRTSVQLLAPGG